MALLRRILAGIAWVTGTLMAWQGLWMAFVAVLPYASPRYLPKLTEWMGWVFLACMAVGDLVIIFAMTVLAMRSKLPGTRLPRERERGFDISPRVQANEPKLTRNH